MTGGRNADAAAGDPRATRRAQDLSKTQRRCPVQTAAPGRSAQMVIESPVDDATYDVLMALASKLEAIDTYKKYATDGQNGQLWQQLAQDDRKHADLLLQELRSRLSSR
jgi:hypothetical protein